MATTPDGGGEFDRIRRHFRPLTAACPGALDLTDDAGLLNVRPGHELVVTTDTVVESMHVLPSTPPHLFAVKALRTNLSDLAAMGAEPVAYTSSLALSKAQDDTWFGAFAKALAEDQDRYGIALLGGDSVRTPGPVSVTITALGTVPAGQAIRRNGARPGHGLWVTGTVGGAALGLACAQGRCPGLSPDQAAILRQCYDFPQPRLSAGIALRGVASAMLDLSDGLPGDLAHICRTSGVGASVTLAALPHLPATRAAMAGGDAQRRWAWNGGDDYELLFAADSVHDDRIRTTLAALGVPVTRIGTITPAAAGVRFVDDTGTPVEDLAGWTHF